MWGHRSQTWLCRGQGSEKPVYNEIDIVHETKFADHERLRDQCSWQDSITVLDIDPMSIRTIKLRGVLPILTQYQGV